MVKKERSPNLRRVLAGLQVDLVFLDSGQFPASGFFYRARPAECAIRINPENIVHDIPRVDIVIALRAATDGQFGVVTEISDGIDETVVIVVDAVKCGWDFTGQSEANGRMQSAHDAATAPVGQGDAGAFVLRNGGGFEQLLPCPVPVS